MTSDLAGFQISLPRSRWFAKVNFGLVVVAQLERDRPAALFQVTQSAVWRHARQCFCYLPGLHALLALE